MLSELMDLETHIRMTDTSREQGFVEVDLQIGPKKHCLYFRSTDLLLTANPEALITMALLPAMKEGRTLNVEGQVSQRFLNALWTIQDIYSAWNPLLHRVEIKKALPVIKAPSEGGKVGTFFSGGVDSFYTLLKHRHEITDLIFVSSFDPTCAHPLLLKKASETIHHIGSIFDKRVIEIETNIVLYLESYFRRSWAALTNGSALATVGHLLFPFFKRIYIPSSHTYTDLVPLGSHPILDPLWSTEALEFTHDGCEANRINKLVQLSEFDVALQNLRVCYLPHPGGNHNCGQCEKCVRTMINLYMAGILDRCPTFDAPLDPKRVSKLIISDTSTRAFVEENLRSLEHKRTDWKLAKALRKALNRPLWQTRLIKKLGRIKRHWQEGKSP